MREARITKARLKDIPDLKAIELDCGLSPWTHAAYRTELKRPDSIILVATDDNARLGFIAGRVPLVPEADAEINNIGVRPEYRHRGLGSALLKKFMEVCSERRAGTIWLEVRPSNSSAIDLYRSHGFVARGIRPNFYRDPAEDAVLMSISPEAGSPT